MNCLLYDLNLHPHIPYKFVTPTLQAPCGILKQPIEATEWIRSVERAMPSTLHHLQVPREHGPESMKVELFLVGKIIVSLQEKRGVIRADRSQRLQIIA
jgi:hypothetical protein